MNPEPSLLQATQGLRRVKSANTQCTALTRVQRAGSLECGAAS